MDTNFTKLNIRHAWFDWVKIGLLGNEISMWNDERKKARANRHNFMAKWTTTLTLLFIVRLRLIHANVVFCHYISVFLNCEASLRGYFNTMKRSKEVKQLRLRFIPLTDPLWAKFADLRP